MVVTPTNAREWQVMADFLHTHARVPPAPDLRVLGWVTRDTLHMVSGFNSWLGATCQVHVACLPGFRFCPRAMLEATFRYAFETADRKLLIVAINSKNRRAMKMDQQLGFREFARLPGMHTEGGDLVLMSMSREGCRYIGPDFKWRGVKWALPVSEKHCATVQ